MSRKLIVKKELNRLSELERNLRESPPGSDEEHYTQNRVSSPSSLVTTSVPSAKTSPNPASQVPLRGRSSTSPPDLNQSSDSLRKACSTRSGKSRKSSSPLVRNPTATSPVSTSSHRVPPKFPEPSRKPSPSSARAVRLREKSPYPLARSSSSPVNTTSSNVGVSTNTAQARSTSTKSLSPLARIQDPQTNLLLKKNISSSTKNLTPSPKGLSSMKKLSSSAKNLHLGHESGSASYPPNEKVKLERVLGLTVPSNAALDCDPHTGQVAYPAGCTVVLLNSRKNRQLHVQNASRKTITCVAFSPCGRYLATGECGHQPSVRVWDVSDRSQVAEFQGHKYGISCVAFSPTQKYVVSVGSQHDMIVNVWDWRGGIKVASNKFSSKVKAISFAENGSYFVTVGNRHVKFWYLEVARGSKFKEPVPLTGRSAILGEQRNNYFCDVACGRGDMGDSTFAITKSGLLCEFNNRRLLDKWVELRTSSANCLVAGEEYIFVGCAESIIRCFSPFNLQFITTLPRTHYLGVDVSKGLTISHMATHPNNAKYPDTIAVAFDENNHKVTAVYNDHSMYVWDVKDIKRVGKSHSYLYHSACIWGVETYPSQGEGVKGVMPPGSFITCSSDDTIRVWNIDSGMPSNTLYKRNIYSSELLKILYVDPELGFIKDTDVSPQGGDRNDTSYDSRNGVRCIRVSPDGKHLASGDRGGNIRVHELQFLDELCKIEAHDAEVLSLEYSRPDTGHRFLASASRDRLIHVFAVDQDYSFVQTLDDHSSAITSVRFYQSQGALQMVSCSADRSIIFRSATMTPQNEVWFSRGHNVAGKTTLYDMEVDHGQRHVLTACQDRNIRVYNVNTGKHSKTFKGSIGDDGTLIKVILDQSGIYAATSCTDKNMCIYDYYSGECMAIMFGHSELVTGLRFTSDGKHLITVSGDGCIFLWRMPHDMTQTMTARLAQQAERASKEKRKPQRQSIDNEDFRPATEDMFDQNANEAEEPDYRFSMGQLPLWAKKQMTEPQGPGGGAGDRGVVDMPKGRWAQRLHNNAITFKSHYDTDSVIPFPAREKRAADSESSKDSSLEDSVGVHKQYNTPRRENMLLTKQDPSGESPGFVPCPDSLKEINSGGTFQVTPSKITTKRGSDLDGRNRHHTDESDVSSLRVDDGTTDHDGDIEDCSEHDDESTEPEHSEHLMYYPHNDDTASDFTVNAMDVEELRRSQRRHRKARPERPTDIPLVSVSGSQDSDDDDEVSTPSADTAERNIMSMLSVSTESIDRVGRRENFLKTNYESLEGEAARPEKEVKNKNSISYKFNARNKDSHVSNKREELLKRIEETRKKLQSIGYKSNLRNSKSISDLSNIPEKDTSYMSGNQDGGSGDSGFSSSPGGGSGGLRRACSLSDLTNPGAPRRLLPTPPSAGGKKGGSKSSGKSPGRSHSLSRSSSIGVLNQTGEDNSRSERPMRPTIASMNKMTPRALKRKASLSQAVSTGDIRQFHEDSSSEDASPSEHKNTRSRTHGSDRRSNLPTRAVSERDLTRSNSLSSKSRGESVRGCYTSAASPISRRGLPSSDISRPSSAASTVDMSPEEYPTRDDLSFIDFENMPLSVGVVESVCEWVVEGCERLSQLWWRACSEGGGEEDHHRALRSLLLGAAARATHALTPLTAPNAAPAPSLMNPAPPPPQGTDSKDPRMVAMMQQYTDILVNMVQQKMASHQPPPGPA
ncbi:mitogen-activated protein kinase-binding protein 1-like isoform X9 [Homarus americanus]|uniref:mitogen-activated protein kinase-binding protein 1-like isoform X9 n=1 Tax=Homarus americanus TaxID=6706 RepID=UPI001C43CDCD|nr:mitogen-activated protein kinase-binding protein 1-like isoform X9 [Homarus americanus]